MLELKRTNWKNWLTGSRLLAGVACLLAAGCETVQEGAETRPVGEPVLSPAQLQEARVALSFRDHVRPILEERCLHCHNKREMPAKYSLESRAEAFDGRRIVPGKANESLLITVLTTGNHAMTMPAVGTAPPREEIEVLKRWIDAGAEWPRGAVLKPRG